MSAVQHGGASANLPRYHVLEAVNRADENLLERIAEAEAPFWRHVRDAMRAGVLNSCSEVYRASDVDCHPTGKTLRGTPVYWCSVSYDDNRASTGACVNLAGSDLAMSGPVIQEEHCNASVAKARTNRFFTEADEVLP